MIYHTIKASGVKRTSAAFFLVVNFEDLAAEREPPEAG